MSLINTLTNACGISSQHLKIRSATSTKTFWPP
jgi:hypothetical protein